VYLVEALYCKPEGRGFESRRSNWICFFNLRNLSSRITALRSTKPLKQNSTRIIPGGKAGPAHKADNPTATCVLIVYKMWTPRRLTSIQASTAYYMDIFTFFTVLSVYSLSLLRTVCYAVITDRFQILI
jgi:hypothetical protein